MARIPNFVKLLQLPSDGSAPKKPLVLQHCRSFHQRDQWRQMYDRFDGEIMGSWERFNLNHLRINVYKIIKMCLSCCLLGFHFRVLDKMCQTSKNSKRFFQPGA